MLLLNLLCIVLVLGLATADDLGVGGITGWFVTADDLGEGDDQIFTPEQLRMMKSRSVNITFPAWTNGKLPYVLDPSFSGSSYHMTALNNSIALFKEKTCINIVPRTTETEYVKFVNTGPNGGCSSYMGMIQANQPISIADWCTGKPYNDGTRSTWYSMVHEIMHCLGYMHEQCRPDRDSFVNVNMSNPTAQNNINYQKAPIADTLTLTHYDYDSVMHYPGQVGLLETIDPKMQGTIGQRDHISDCDVAKINKYYKCPSNYQQTACPLTGQQAGTTTQAPQQTTTEADYNWYPYYY